MEQELRREIDRLHNRLDRMEGFNQELLYAITEARSNTSSFRKQGPTRTNQRARFMDDIETTSSVPSRHPSQPYATEDETREMRDLVTETSRSFKDAPRPEFMREISNAIVSDELEVKSLGNRTLSARVRQSPRRNGQLRATFSETMRQGHKTQVKFPLHRRTWAPESALVTTFDFLYWLIAVLEFGYVAVHVGGASWGKPPSNDAIVLMCVASGFLTLCMVMRSRTRVIRGWDCLDNPEAIFRDYVRTGWFFFDIVTSFPFDLCVYAGGSNMGFRVLNILRVLRGFRLTTLFRTTNPLQPTRTFRKVMAFFSSVTWGHVLFATIWMLINQQGDKYESSLEYFSIGIYWAVQTSTSVGYGDVSINDQKNRIYSIISMLVGVGSYSYFISVMSASFVASDAMAQQLQDKQAKLSSLMTHFKMPWELQKQILVLYPRIFKLTKKDYADVIDSFPPFLQKEMLYHMRIQNISIVPMFSDAEVEVKEFLARRMYEVFEAPGMYLIRQGDVGKNMFFLSHGIVEVLIEEDDDDGCGEQQHVQMMKDGSWFGELSLLKEIPCTASVRTITACDLLVLGKEDFLRIFRMFPDSKFVEKLENTANERSPKHLNKSTRENSGRTMENEVEDKQILT